MISLTFRRGDAIIQRSFENKEEYPLSPRRKRAHAGLYSRTWMTEKSVLTFEWIVLWSYLFCIYRVKRHDCGNLGAG